MANRFKNIFDKFKKIINDKNLTENPIDYFKDKVICYEKEKDRFVIYQITDSELIGTKDPVIDWMYNDKLWFFYDWRSCDFAAHVEFVSEYAPEIRLSSRLDVFV